MVQRKVLVTWAQGGLQLLARASYITWAQGTVRSCLPVALQLAGTASPQKTCCTAEGNNQLRKQLFTSGVVHSGTTVGDESTEGAEGPEESRGLEASTDAALVHEPGAEPLSQKAVPGAEAEAFGDELEESAPESADVMAASRPVRISVFDGNCASC